MFRFPLKPSRLRSKNPNILLNLSLLLRTVCAEVEPNKYSLRGIVVHSGTFHSGHYVAFVKRQNDVIPILNFLMLIYFIVSGTCVMMM